MSSWGPTAQISGGSGVSGSGEPASAGRPNHRIIPQAVSPPVTERDGLVCATTGGGCPWSPAGVGTDRRVIRREDHVDGDRESVVIESGQHEASAHAGLVEVGAVDLQQPLRRPELSGAFVAQVR